MSKSMLILLLLCENMITEAVVSLLTTLDNKFSLPCAVDCTTQKGKTGEAMAKEFETHKKTVQLSRIY